MPEHEPASPAPPRRSLRERLAWLRPWLLPAAAFVLMLLVAWNLWSRMHREVWTYYTDDAGTRVELREDLARPVLWEDPQPTYFDERQGDPGSAQPAGPVNEPTGRLEASFSADGTMMVLVRWDELRANADLYLSRWDGRLWSRPEPVEALNSPTDDRGPAFSRDGQYLYFSSNRAGGRGGYDIYVSRWNGHEWTGAEPLGKSVNTAANELGPSLSPDGKRLYFSSNRGGGADIFVARRIGDKEADPVAAAPKTPPKGKRKQNKKPRKKPSRPPRPAEHQPQPLAPVPQFAAAEPVDHLNSKADDVEAAMTKRGDHVFLASDRDRSRKAGFGVYLSRVVNGEVQPPEKVDLYIDEGNTTDPAVRMEGFDLLFSTDHETAGTAGRDDEGSAPGFRLFRSTTREVIGYTDLGRWEQFKTLMRNIAWWILLAIAALLALIYLLEHWRDITSLFHKCLAGSLAVHLLALLLAMIWFIAVELESDAEPPSAEIEISIDALAQEELAMESVPEETQITETETALATKKVESEFDIPKFEPQETAESAPIETSTTREAMDFVVQPSKAEQSDQPVPEPVVDSSVLSELAETILPVPETPELEERTRQAETPPTNPDQDLFRPEEPSPAVTQAEATPITDRAVENPTEVNEVDPAEPVTSDTRVSVAEVLPTITEQPLLDEPLPQPALESNTLSDLPETAFVDPNQTPLEETDPSTPPTTESPADPTQDVFAPSESMAKVETMQTEGESVADSSVANPADAAEVATGNVASASPVSDVRPSEVGQAPTAESVPQSTPDAGLPAASLPATALVDPGAPTLDEGDPDEAPGTPADPAKDLFEPRGSAANLATMQSEGEAVADSSVANPADAAEVANGNVASASPVSDVRPSEVGQAPAAESVPQPTPAAGLPAASLPATALVDPGAPTLDEGDPDEAPGTPADPAKDLFEPRGSASKLATMQSEGESVADSSVANPADAAEVATGNVASASPVSDVRPSEVGQAPAAESVPQPTPAAGLPAASLPATALVDPGAPTLDEGDPNKPPGTPADPAKDLFEPRGSAAKLATMQTEGESVADSSVANPADAAEVATGNVASASPVSDVRPSEVGQAPAAESVPQPTPAAGLPAASLPATALVDPGAPTLDEGDPNKPPGTPADPAKDLFKPRGSAAMLVSTQAGGRAVADTAVTHSANASQVESGAARNQESSQVTPLRGMESNDPLPQLALGPATLEAPSAPFLPGKLETPNHDLDANTLAKFIRKQRGKPSLETVRQLGGSDGTEKAISAAIRWLTENQEDDGRWDTRKHGAKGDYDTGGTGLALLCFYGWGARHDRPGDYQQHVRRAIDWLVAQQADDGDLGGPGLMYCHAISTIALCEAYGITRDPKLKGPAEKAIAYTLAAQSTTKGGWRYHPGNDSDTSITGWQYMALHSARMAGLMVPEENFKKVRDWLNRVGGGKHGGLYGYQGPGKSSPAMVATGMFCRQLDLIPPEDPIMNESARLLKMRPMDADDTDLYYVYYATLALYQHQGPIWKQWNEDLKTILPLTQRKTGPLAGSWNHSSGITSTGGRVASTTLATLSLEVYYRLLPMYGFRNEDAPPAKLKGNNQ